MTGNHSAHGFRTAAHALRRPATRDAAAVLAIVAMWLLFYWRLFTPSEIDRVQFPSGDFTQQFLVFRRFAFAELRAGRWPVWMPCIDGGYPYQADPQSALFYPPALLNLAAQAIGGAQRFSLEALEIEATLHVLLAALSMYGFLRGETRRRSAALVGALVFGFGGYLTGYPVLQLAIVETAAWLPLALWGARQLAHARRGLRATALAVALTAAPLALSILAGHPQTYTFVFYVVAFYLAYRARRERLAWRSISLRLAVAFGLAVALSAVQLVPSFEYTRLSTRAELPYTESSTGFPLADIAQIVVAGVVSHFSPLYVGLLPLALLGLTIGVRRGDAAFWLVLGAAGLLVSFGGHLAVFDPIYFFAPGYRLFRDQERHALIVAMSASVLAAYGADVLAGSLSRRARVWLRGEIRWLAAGWLLLAVALAVTLYASWQDVQPDLESVPDRVALSVLALGATLVVFALRSIRPARRVLPALWVGILAFDLATANRAVNWTAPADPFPPQASIEAIGADAPAGSIFRVHDEKRLPGHSLCASGLDEVGGITPIHLASYERFTLRVPRVVRWGLLNVRYVVTWRGALENATPIARQGEGADAIYTYRLNADHPRAWVVHRVEVKPGREAIEAALAAPGFDPLATAYTTEPVRADSAAGADRLSIAALRPAYVHIDADLASAGLLVASEVNYPGWMATVNGVETPIIEVNGLLRGVAVPSGLSRIEFVYRPSSLYVGGLISGVALVAWIALLVVRGRAS